MHDIPRQQLCHLIAQYGPALCDDPLRCEGLLRDLCGNHKQEVFLLGQALKEGIGTELRSSSEGIAKEVLLKRLTKRLEDNLGLRSEASIWAVESWGLALGKLSSEELTSRTASQRAISHSTPSMTETPKSATEGSILQDTDTPSSPTSKPLHELQKMSVPLLCLLIVITGGIYSGIWFWQRLSSFNSLPVSTKLSTIMPIFAMVMFSLGMHLRLADGLFLQMAVALNDPGLWNLFYSCGYLALLSGSVSIITLSFNSKSILDEHFNKNLKKGIILSGALTFFFQVLYMQYKINKLKELDI